jgi:MFS family permease
VGAVALLLGVQAALTAAGTSLAAYALLLLAFFVAFNVLEALLPSLVSRMAPAHARGTAIAVYNTAQTLGLFFGGLLGGWVAKHHGIEAVYQICAVLAAAWLVLAYGMRAPTAAVNDVSSLTLSIASGVNIEGLGEALARVHGVREAEVLSQQRIARLKVVAGQWDESGARKLVTGEV